MFSELWKQIVKIVCLSVQINFSEKKIFSWKTVQFGNVFQNGGRGGRESFCWNLWKKRIFGRKLSGALSERDSTFPELLFEVRCVFPKNILEIIFFQTFSIVLVFCRFLTYLSEIRPCVQMKVLRKVFKREDVYEILSEREQKFFVLWQQHFNRLSKMGFICLEQFFHGDFFCLEDYKQLNNFFGNGAVCLRKN